MAIRTGHGTGAGVPRVEVLPPDEAPSPVAAPPDAVSGVNRRQDGTVADREAAAALGRKGGRVRAKGVRLARGLGIPLAVTSEAFRPYRLSANAFRRHHCGELARMAGGELGSGPSSMVASAALQLAASRFLFDQAAATSDPATFQQASRLANDSRQNLLAAYEMAVRAAGCRPPPSPEQTLAAIRARLIAEVGK